MILTKDVFEEILLRLPVKSFTRCKSLSKYWYNFISFNTLFRQTYMSRLPPSSSSPLMLGFFAFRSHTKTYLLITRFPVVPISDDIHFVPTCDRGGKLKSGEFNTREWDAPPLPHPHPFDESLAFPGLEKFFIAGLSNGFLLCCLEEYNPMSYIVCNPITKEWIALPKPTLTDRCIAAAFICQGNYPCLKLVNYTIVRPIRPPIRGLQSNLSFEVFSSEDFQWKVFHLTCSTPFFLDMRNTLHTLLNKQGCAHWIVSTKCHLPYPDEYTRAVLLYDQRKVSLEVVAVPGEYPSAWDCLSDSGGLLLYARFRPKYKVEIFVLKESEEGRKRMFLKHRVNLKSAMCRFPPGWGVHDATVIAVHPSNTKVIFLASRSYRKVACYNAETSTVDWICDLPVHSLTYEFVVYVWPNWPLFFP